MSAAFRDPLTVVIADFLREIGLGIRPGTVAGQTALPGIDIDNGTLVVDDDRLLHPGDVLHEAGHLAVVPPERRAAFHHDVGNDPAEEMMAIAWSYAAALHLNIDPAIVFHEAGYRGGSASILENFSAGQYFAVPMLQWVGLTYDSQRATKEGAKSFPHMRHWLREA